MDNKEKFEQILKEITGGVIDTMALKAMQSAYDLAIKDSLLVGGDVEELAAVKYPLFDDSETSNYDQYSKRHGYVVGFTAGYSTLSSRIEARIKELEELYQKKSNDKHEQTLIRSRLAELKSFTKR